MNYQGSVTYTSNDVTEQEERQMEIDEEQVAVQNMDEVRVCWVRNTKWLAQEKYSEYSMFEN